MPNSVTRWTLAMPQSSCRFSHRWFLEMLRNWPPAEAKAVYYRRRQHKALAAWPDQEPV